MLRICGLEDLRETLQMDRYQQGREGLLAQTKSNCAAGVSTEVPPNRLEGMNTPINTAKVSVDVRRNATKDVHRNLRTSPEKGHGDQGHQPPE
jgi:hypothetical protein